MIRAVVFDFGNVICSFDPGLFIRHIATYSALSKKELAATVMTRCDDLMNDYESGRISSHDFFVMMSGRCRLSAPEPAFVKAFVEIFTPIPETLELLRRLKGRYRLGLLSNTNEWHYQHGILRADAYPIFDTVTLSFEVKAMKPHRRIFEDAMAKLREPPEACVYIDDLCENADAAAKLGMHAIHYTGHEGLMKDLRNLQVI